MKVNAAQNDLSESPEEVRHTPTPWRVREGPLPHQRDVIAGDGSVATVCWGRGAAVDQANAEFIVRAVNAHDALTGAMQEALALLRDDLDFAADALLVLQAALALAGRSDEEPSAAR